MDQKAENEQVCDELLRLLRVQRHDFINHLQVIHAMLQLRRTDKALAYIENLATDDSLISDQLHGHVQQRECQRKA